MYDSKADTLAHIDRVARLVIDFVERLEHRAAVHDQSKLHSPEKEAFDIATPKLKGLTYGSDEYRAALREIKPALEHHYANNSHHPEYYPNGINGMSLLDIVEMFCDWKAASERHDDGCIYASIEKNQARFLYTEQLKEIFLNTAKELGWIRR